MPWNDVVCHPSVRETIQRSIQRGMFAGTHIIHGPAGAGQDTIAISLAKTLFCPEMEHDFCDECAICTRIENETFSDVIHLTPENDWAEPKKPKRQYAIDHMRMVIKFAREQPYETDRKLFLMHRAEDIGVEAANCLLKMLEEPPAHVQFLLLTDALNAILPTILSRSRKIRLIPLKPDQLVSQLQSRVKPEQAWTLAIASGGLPSTAEVLLENDFLQQRDEILEWLQRIRQEPTSLDEAIQWWSGAKTDLDTRLDICLGLLRDGLMIASGLQDGPFRHPDRLEDIRALWQNDPPRELVADLEQTLDFIEKRPFNPNAAVAMTRLLLQFSRQN